MPPQPTHAARSDGASPAPVASRDRPTGWASGARILVAPTLAGLAALVVWWAIVRIFEIPDYLLPAPQAVAARIVKEWPVLVKHGSYTLLSVLTGFVSAVVIGVPLAFGIVLSRSMERVAMAVSSGDVARRSPRFANRGRSWWCGSASAFCRRSRSSS